MADSTMLSYISDNYQIIEADSPVRAKKRRLDHLSWEEKLQRKKLKNRVAAQTSRDRKKAKMELMEASLQELMEKNNKVLQECENLKRLNEKLMQENADLNKKMQGPCANCCKSQNKPADCNSQSLLGSAEGCSDGSIVDSEFGTSANGDSGFVENCNGLPSLPDLLDDLNKDFDLESLQQLTQSLLQDIAADLQATASEADNEESKVGKHGEMVGPTSKLLESSGRDGVRDQKLESEISKYLRLHHDYSAKPQDDPKSLAKRIKTNRNTSVLNVQPKKAQSTKSKLKQIRPKQANKNIPKEPLESNVVYGTYDETNNCITIIVNDEDICLEEAVTEIIDASDVESNKEMEIDSVDLTLGEDVSDLTESISQFTEFTKPNPVKVEKMKYLSVPKITELPNSPTSSQSDYSDYGYESASPHSILDNELDLWDQSITELFPSLA